MAAPVRLGSALRSQTRLTSRPVELQPLQTSRVSTNRASVLHQAGRTYLVKRYTGDLPGERLACEKLSLGVWADAGFKVPAVSTLEIPELRGTEHLVIEFLNGPTLQDRLKDNAVGIDEKWELLSRILADNCRRQSQAIARREPRLLHPDPNSSNIICVDHEHYFIDFETTVPAGDLEDAAAVETAKFLRWTARDIGRAHLPEIARHAAAAYRDNADTLQRIVTRTCDRPFQWFHRWHDRRRKQRQPGEVTKYDIADALASALRSFRS